MRVSLAMAATLALSALAVSVSAAPAPESAPTTVAVPSTATAPSADDSKIVCKTIAVTGTRFPEQTCHTKREWAEMAQAARDYVQHATTGACQGSGCH